MRDSSNCENMSMRILLSILFYGYYIRCLGLYCFIFVTWVVYIDLCLSHSLSILFYVCHIVCLYCFVCHMIYLYCSMSVPWVVYIVVYLSHGLFNVYIALCLSHGLSILLL